jgi:hypothetical protein
VAEIAETVVRGVSQDGRIEPRALVPHPEERAVAAIDEG